jgi:hypothetical protein
MLFTFYTKQATLMRRSIVPSLPAPLVFPDVCINYINEWPGQEIYFRSFVCEGASSFRRKTFGRQAFG